MIENLVSRCVGLVQHYVGFIQLFAGPLVNFFIGLNSVISYMDVKFGINCNYS